MKIDNENFFEVAEALHCWLTLNHKGQWSAEYAALCRSQFKPGRLWSETRVEQENEFYSEITEKNWQQIETELNEFLETLE